ncbi:MAG: hypothetical protein HYV66_03155 [Candidatus Sungbacteria bacterium]|nr:hypothetical protein [Candidatus Sungbacteria bacterium]
MARETGDLISCLRKTRHHVSVGNAGLLVAVFRLDVGGDPEEVVKGRFELIRDELDTALRQVERIKQVAAENGFAEITAIVSEEVEFGHER